MQKLIFKLMVFLVLRVFCNMNKYNIWSIYNVIHNVLFRMSKINNIQKKCSIYKFIFLITI